MNMMVLYVSYFLIIATFLSRSCVSAPTNSKCPYGTNCVFATSCPTVIRYIHENKINLLQDMYCKHEGDRPKVCCPSSSSDSFNDFRTIETETYKYNKTTDNDVDKITFPTDTSTTNPYIIKEYKLATEIYKINLNPFPNKTICGLERGSDRIVGGSIAEIDEFPWLGRLLYESDRKMVFLCGASLITDRYLVTAAHCLMQGKGKPVSVRLGEWDEDTERDCQNNYCSEKPVDIEIEKIFTYKDNSNIKVVMSADIGLIKLKEPVKFTEFISPICLPDTDYIKMQEYAQSVPYWTTGWGITEFGMPSTLKRKISLNGVSSEICRNIYKTYEKSLFDRVICAGGMDGRDSCSGDSGGPLMKVVEEDYQTNWYLFGITSFGPKRCGSEGKPSIYTKVSAYMDWIQSIVRNEL